MKTQIVEFIHTLNLYDYLLFGGIIFFFLLFLILSIMFHQRIRLAITFVLLAFILLFTAPVIGYILLHSFVYKHKITLTTVQDLEFSDALVIKGDLNNTSSQTLKECTLYTGISQVSSIQPLNTLYTYLPFRRKSLTINGPIAPAEGTSFKLLIEPFSYPKHFQVTVRGNCR